MLEENINTYATILFADDYIENHFSPFYPLRVHFSVLTDIEKGSYLKASLQEIERLPFIGRKRLVNQPLAFPRLRSGNSNLSPTYMSMFIGENISIPECIKEAQVENALGILLKEISSVSDKQFMTMQSLGSIKNTKYNKREAGDLGFGENLTGMTVKKCPIASAKAYALLRDWLGGVSVC